MLYPIIHIGFSKTATTWFQEFYFPKVKNVHYINKRNTNKFLFDNEPYDESLSNENRFLFSSEGISGPVGYSVLNEDQWKLNAQRIAKLFPNAEIVVFIRNQIDMISSIYSQYLRNGGNYSASKYFFSANNYFKKSFLEYHYLIDHYIQTFGKIHIFSYEDFANEPYRFIQEFERRVGLESDMDYNLLKTIQNPGINANNVLLIRFLNLFINTPTIPKFHIASIPQAVGIRNRLLKKTKEKGLLGEKTKNVFLKPDEITFLKRYYANSNSILLNEHGLEFIKRYNYPL